VTQQLVLETWGYCVEFQRLVSHGYRPCYNCLQILSGGAFASRVNLIETSKASVTLARGYGTHAYANATRQCLDRMFLSDFYLNTPGQRWTRVWKNPEPWGAGRRRERPCFWLILCRQCNNTCRRETSPCVGQRVSDMCSSCWVMHHTNWSHLQDDA
jgi:hypothetical protein